MKHEESVWTNGVGRIRREAFLLLIGDKSYDVDELRRYSVPGDFKALIAELNPGPTAAECIWLMRFASRYDHVEASRMGDFLLDLIDVQPDAVVASKAL